MRSFSQWFRRPVVRLTVIGITVLLLVAWPTSPPDPKHKGKRLSKYLAELVLQPLNQAQAKLPERQRSALLKERTRNHLNAKTAIRRLGTRSIPLISTWLEPECEPRQGFYSIHQWLTTRLSELLRVEFDRVDRTEAAYQAAALVPQHGAALIPVLRKRIALPNSPDWPRAGALFEEILDSLPPEEAIAKTKENLDLLIELSQRPRTNSYPAVSINAAALLFRYDPPADREGAIRRLWAFRGNRFVSRTIPDLDPDSFIQNMLSLETGHAREKAAALRYFRTSPVCGPRVIPLVISNLVHSTGVRAEDACATLGAFGLEAVAAVPVMSDLLAHKHRPIAWAAADAIERICDSTR